MGNVKITIETPNSTRYLKRTVADRLEDGEANYITTVLKRHGYE